MGKNLLCLEFETMKVHNLKDNKLSKEEKDIATVLINDGWYGSYDELIECVRRLAK